MEVAKESAVKVESNGGTNSAANEGGGAAKAAAATPAKAAAKPATASAAKAATVAPATAAPKAAGSAPVTAAPKASPVAPATAAAKTAAAAPAASAAKAAPVAPATAAAKAAPVAQATTAAGKAAPSALATATTTKPAAAGAAKASPTVAAKSAGAKPAAASTTSATAGAAKPQGATAANKRAAKPTGGASKANATANGASVMRLANSTRQRRKAFDVYGRICQIPAKDRTESQRTSFEWAKKIVKEALGGDMTKYKLSQFTKKTKGKINAPIANAAAGAGNVRGGAQQAGNSKRKAAIGQGPQVPIKRNRYDSPRSYTGRQNDDTAQYGTEIVKQLLTTLLSAGGAFNDNDNMMGDDMNNGNYNNAGPSGNYGDYGPNMPYGGRPDNMNSNGGNFNNFPPQFNNANANNAASFNAGFSNAPQSSYPSGGGGGNRPNDNFNYSSSQPMNNSYNSGNRNDAFQNAPNNRNIGANYPPRNMSANSGPINARPGGGGGGGYSGDVGMGGGGVGMGGGNAIRSGGGGGGGGGGASLSAMASAAGLPNAKNQYVLGIIDKNDKNFYISPAKWKAVEVKLTNVFLGVLREHPGAPPVCRDGGWHQGRIKLIICADQRSAILYRLAVSRLGQVWRNAKLEAVPWNEDSDRPKTHCYLPAQPSDPTSILQIIKTSNPNLPAANWRIGKLEEPKGDSRFAIILIDQKSLEPLAKCNWVINYGFSSIQLKLSQKQRQQQSSDNSSYSSKVYDDSMDDFGNTNNNNSNNNIINRAAMLSQQFARRTGQNYTY